MDQLERKRLRSYLNEWLEAPDVNRHAIDCPDCVTEQAAAATGGRGPVRDEERLRYYVTTRSDIDIARKPNGKITSAIFKRAFKTGMSTVRFDHADRDELNRTARLLYDHQSSAYGDHGGVIGVVDFTARSVRQPADDNEQYCCVLETPFPDRPSHADVVSRHASVSQEMAKGLQLLLFNAIGGTKAFLHAHQVDDCDLREFIPKSLK